MSVQVAVSPRFEICYALAGRAAEAAAANDPVWLSQARALGERFWVAVPDALDDSAPEPTLDAFFAALEAVPVETFRERLSRGLFHEEGSPEKREWLAYIGAEDRRKIEAQWRTGDIKARSLSILARFAEAEFKAQWSVLQPQLTISADTARRLAGACSFAELAQQLLLRVEIDEEAGRLKALRGGYTLPLAEIGEIYLLPSAFNKRRLFHAADLDRPATVFFPYFDPEISVEGRREEAIEEFDPWLICRALGDPTRAAMVRRLARGETNAAELVAELGVSKANISHHVFQLREAGLIAEEREGRTVRLKLRGDRLHLLSDRLALALDLVGGRQE